MEPFWRLVWRWLRSRSKTKRTGWTRSFTCSRGWPSAHSTNLVLQGKWRNTMHCVCFRSTSSMRFVCLFVFWVFLFDRRTENWDWYRPCTVCWIEVKVAVLCAHQYMPWNLLLIKVLNNFWYFQISRPVHVIFKLDKLDYLQSPRKDFCWYFLLGSWIGTCSFFSFIC